MSVLILSSCSSTDAQKKYKSSKRYRKYKNSIAYKKYIRKKRYNKKKTNIGANKSKKKKEKKRYSKRKKLKKFKRFKRRKKRKRTKEIPAENNISLSISPYFTSRVNKTKDISYGGEYNRKDGRHELNTTYQRNQYESTDPLAKITIKTASHAARFTYDINKMWGPLTYFFMFEYAQKQEGEIFIKYHEVRAGPLGIKYDIIETKNTDLSISYIPLYEYLVEDVDQNEFDSNFSSIYKRASSRNIRNSFRLKSKWYFLNKKLEIKDTIFWRPIYNLNDKTWDYKDADFQNIFKIKYNLDDVFSISYSNKITWSERLVRVHRLPSTDMENKWELEFTHSF